MSGMRTMGLALFVLGAALTVVAVAEDVTVSTYYPSPKGVYQQLSTTGQTVLATGGGSVGIGTAAPGATLDVNGNCNVVGPTTLGNTLTAAGAVTFNNGLQVTAGNTTVGTLTAAATTVGPLTAGATTAASVTTNGFAMPPGSVNGRVLTSDGAGNGTWQQIVYQ